MFHIDGARAHSWFATERKIPNRNIPKEFSSDPFRLHLQAVLGAYKFFFFLNLNLPVCPRV